MKRLISMLLGFILLVMGANKFLGFMPMFEVPPNAAQFMKALGETGYMFPMIGIVEIVCGLMFLNRSTAPLATILLAPLSINIIAFHAFLAPDSIFPGLMVFTANLFLGVMFFDYYRPMFTEIFTGNIETANKGTHSSRPLSAVNH